MFCLHSTFLCSYHSCKYKYFELNALLYFESDILDNEKHQNPSNLCDNYYLSTYNCAIYNLSNKWTIKALYMYTYINDLVPIYQYILNLNTLQLKNMQRFCL